jgi:hypothetical protein
MREQRWKSFEVAYGRLPLWLQLLLFPWTIPARFLAFFPILTPLLCLAGAGFLAYLKLYYLHEQVTWAQVGSMMIGPLLVPVLLTYMAFSVVMMMALAAFSPVYALMVFVRLWRGEPHPFSLAHPRTNGRLIQGSRLLWDRDLEG